MKKISTLLLLSTTLFLSTFFVGCKPQEEPIALEDITLSPRKKVVEKTSPVEKSVQIEEQQSPEIQPEEKNKNKRLVVVNVTVDGGPAIGATVTLSKSTHGEDLFFEKKTEKTGCARFHINKSIKGFYATAYNDEYASVNILRRRLSPKDLSPITIDLNLKDKGVLITAILENKPDKIENLQAKIVSSKSFGLQATFAVTTKITGNKIFFPPVQSGTTGMRVYLAGDNIPQCYSDKFNTKADREVIVKIPVSVTLKGTVLLPDGSPFTNEFSINVSDGKESKGIYYTGKSSGKIQPESDGGYTFSKLTEGNFRIRMRIDNYENFETNLYLKPSENHLDFSLRKTPVMNITGIVVTEFDDQPVEGITVYASRSRNMPPYASSVTDKEGKFTIEVRKTFRDYYGSLIVDEPEYGKVSKGVSSREKFIKIILRAAGAIKGKVLTQDGKPLAGAYVLISKMAPKKRDRNKKFEQAHYNTSTDKEGNYEFKNVIAPAKYGFEYVNDQSGSYSIPVHYSEHGYTVEVEPNQTTECDLIVDENAVLALKAVDNEGNPVTKFSFSHSITTDKKYTRSTSFRNQVDVFEDEWFYFNCGSDGAFNCKALAEESGLSLSTNDIPFQGGKTNYITLIFADPASEVILSGKVLKPDGTPANLCDIYTATRSGNYNEALTDSNGSFKLRGKKIKAGENLTVRVRSYRDKLNVKTNLPAGAKNVIIKLPPSFKIIGKVFLDDLDTPAKNFIISEKRNKQTYNSKDGSFEFSIERMIYNSREAKIITISADDYLPIFVKYDFSKKSILDIGNIILKSGETAKIYGRVVNQNGKPLDLTVALKYWDLQKTFSTRTDGEDGTYAFEDVPPGKARIATRSRLGYTALYDLEVKEGDDLELPDLVLNYTNATVVKLTFKLPDGTYPENTQVRNNDRFYIRDNGVAKGELKIGKYSDWKIKYDGKTYIADEFEITESTDELEVWMQEER